MKKKNIFTVGICTHCDNRLLSYRRDRNKTARLFNFVGIKSSLPERMKKGSKGRS